MNEKPSNGVSQHNGVTCTAEAARVEYEIPHEKTPGRLMAPAMYVRIFAAFPEPVLIWLVTSGPISAAVLLEANDAAGVEFGAPLHDVRQSTLCEVFPDDWHVFGVYLQQAHELGDDVEFACQMRGRRWYGMARPVAGLVLLTMWATTD